ncbi:hypothetical protein Leryth_024432, partial [Lithospermum erythrorhizon]
MDDYLQKTKSIADNLTAAFSHVTEYELVSHILFGLPNDNDSICSSGYERGVPINVEELSTLLITMEVKINQKTHSKMTANIASKIFGNVSNKNFKYKHFNSDVSRFLYKS